jgi:translation initiation factor 1A
MPKNKGKGGKNRRRGKNENDDVKRELILKDDGQSYAQVTRILGNGHLEAFCFDNAGGKKRLCHIRGKLRKKQWINQGDVILVGLRDYQDDKADVIMKYHADEARELKRMREIPENINITDTTTNPTEGLEDVIFDERYNEQESSGDEKGLPHNVGGQLGGNDSMSEDDSDEGEDESNNYYNPNRMPKNTGNLNARNLLGSKKESGKGARNDRREAISGSDSDANDELAHV